MSEKDFMDAISRSQNQDGAFVGPYVQKPKAGPRGPHEIQEKPKHQVFPFTHHLDVFVVFRPWEACKRCWKAFEEGNEPEQEPNDSDDKVCPHTRRAQYLALMQRIMKDGYRCIGRKAETLKSGVIQVSVEWWVPDEKEPVVPKVPRRL